MQKPIGNVLRELGIRGVPRQVRSDRPVPRHSGTYESKRYSSEVTDETFDELTPVRIVCKACRGHIFFTKDTPDGRTYARVRCQWCTEGSMSGEQVNSYLNNDKIIETLVKRYLE